METSSKEADLLIDRAVSAVRKLADSNGPPTDVVEKVRLLGATTAVRHSDSQQSLSPGNEAGKSKWIVVARKRSKTIAIALVASAALTLLFVVPAEFQLHGKGTLEPKKKAAVIAGIDGNIVKVNVKSGDKVEKDDTFGGAAKHGTRRSV